MFHPRSVVLSLLVIPALLCRQPSVQAQKTSSAKGSSVGMCGPQAKADGDKQNKSKIGHAEQVVRDAARLDSIKTIAVIPVVIQIRFDREKRLPDPAKMRARIASATAIPSLLTQPDASSKYKFLVGDEVSRAIKDLNWTVTDLYVVKSGATWDAPAEVLKGGKKDEVALTVKKADMKNSPEECSLFRYTLHDVPEPTTGLATYKPGVFVRPDMEKVKALREKLGVDAVLFLQVADMDDSRGYTGNAFLVGGFIFGQRAETTGVRVQATLVGPTDNPILWQATARGVKTTTTGLLHAGNMKSEMDKQALEGTADAVRTLLSDLCDGTGVPMK